MTQIARNLAVATVALLGVSQPDVSRAESIDECGSFIVGYDGCVLFDSFEPGVPARVLRDPPAELPPVARVQGEVVRCSVDCAGLPGIWCIESAIVEECPSEALGCGVLGFKRGDLGTICYLWESESLGAVLLAPEDAVGHEVGAELHATGVLAYAEFSLCHEPVYFAKVSLAACIDEPTQTSATTWGRLRALYR